MGNHRKPIVSVWFTESWELICDWQDISSSYLNCLTWNPRRMNEFCLGGAQGIINFCTIDDRDLKVLQGRVSLLHDGNNRSIGDITACAYLTAMLNLVLCATKNGSVTCWNTRLALCLFHWRADSNEIGFLRIYEQTLVTGSSTGLLQLWNLAHLYANLQEPNSSDKYEF